jgi:hypothetical protein
VHLIRNANFKKIAVLIPCNKDDEVRELVSMIEKGPFPGFQNVTNCTTAGPSVHLSFASADDARAFFNFIWSTQ